MKEILGEIIRDELVLKIKDNNILEITEPTNKGKSSLLQRVFISDVPENSFALTPDLNSLDLDEKALESLEKKFGKKGMEKFSWLIKDDHPHANKTSDFVLISPYTGCDYKVFIGELKSDLHGDQHRFQLINTKLYMKYILNIINEYHNKKVDFIYELITLTQTENYKKFYRKSELSQKKYGFNLIEEPYMVPVCKRTKTVNYIEIIGQQ